VTANDRASSGGTPCVFGPVAGSSSCRVTSDHGSRGPIIPPECERDDRIGRRTLGVSRRESGRHLTGSRSSMSANAAHPDANVASGRSKGDST
jgi:hypothetical protein